MASQKSTKISLTKAAKKAYGKPPLPWQIDAVSKAAEQYDQRVMLIDHPRGSGKTREIAMQTFVSLRCNSTRLVLLIADRTDLEEALRKEVRQFLDCNGYQDIVESCSKARDVEKAFARLEEEEGRCAVLTVTLQTFPHIKHHLSPELRKTTIVLADEVHRSHADKSLTEEMDRVLGGPVPLRMYTGTATERCLRLFGNRVKRQGVNILQPFHSVSEHEVAQFHLIYEMSQFKVEHVDIDCDTSRVDEAAKRQSLDANLLDGIYVQSRKTLQAVRHKAKLLLDKFMALRRQVTAFVPAMMFVCDSRVAVLEVAREFKSLSTLDVYAAFSGSLESDGQSMDEKKYNASLYEKFEAEPHKKADVLVVCDRFETGYDNSAVCLMGIDRRITSSEKLIQVFSRANRRRPGKPAPVVVDFQNPPLDVQRAIVEFSVTRECLASDDAVGNLSSTLNDVAADLLDMKGEALAEALGSKEPALRERLSEILPAYLRCRGKGVDKDSCADKLVPHSKAMNLWTCLRECHKSEVAAVRKKCKEIATANTVVRGFSSLEIDSQFATNYLHAVPTPQKRTFGEMIGPESDITPEKVEPIVSRLSTLEQFQGILPNNAEPLDVRIGAQAPWTVAKLGADLQILRKRQRGLTRSGYSALQRVVAAASDGPGQQCLIELGVVAVLIDILRIGEQVEKHCALAGMKRLASVDEYTSKVVGVVHAVDALRGCSIIRKDPELKALQELRTFVQQELKALTKVEALKEAIADKKGDIKDLSNTLKASRLVKTGRNLVSELSSDSESDDNVFSRYALARAPINLTKVRRRLKKQKAQLREKNERDLSVKIEREKAKLAELESQLSKKICSLPLLIGMDLNKVLISAASMCGRRAGVREARKCFLELFQSLEQAEDPAAAGFETFAEDVAKIQKAKLATAKPLSDAIATRFSELSPEMLAAGQGLGVVDDLVNIVYGPKSTGACLKILRKYAPLDDKAQEVIDRYEDAKARVETSFDRQGNVDIDVVAITLSSMRKERPCRKRTRTAVEIGDEPLEFA